jgi:hypothetical protein
MRRAVQIVLVFVLVWSMALPAAARPEVYPPEPVEYDFEFDAGFPCDFAMGVFVDGREGAVVFEDRAVLTAPGLHAVLTNLDTGTTRSYRIPGVFLEEYFDDGTTRITAVGPSILFGLFDGVPGMFFLNGKVVVETSDFEDFTWIEEETRGTIVDVCAQLT